MISIVITAYKEPKTIGKAIEAILNQDIDEKYELIVACPDRETADVVKKYSEKHKAVKHFKDPGKGKFVALNQLFKILKGRIWIFTDGDVYLGDNAINEILKKFEREKVGCVSGRPVSSNPRKTKFGYWSHLLMDAGAHRARLVWSRKKGFIECSGYLFAFRNNGVITKIPEIAAEDAIIPYYFYKKGYSVDYAPRAIVYVKNPTNLHDWLTQKIRNVHLHENLLKVAPDYPRVKTFKNELFNGLVWVWSYPRNLKELIWTFELMWVRLYMWVMSFYLLKIKKKVSKNNWKRIESTK